MIARYNSSGASELTKVDSSVVIFDYDIDGAVSLETPQPGFGIITHYSDYTPFNNEHTRHTQEN